MMQKKIRILHVAQSAGGVDRYLRMLLKYLDHNKYENIFACSYDFRRKDYEGLVISFEQVDMERAISINDIRSIIAIRKLIKMYKPDIVYAHSSKAGAVARVADIGLHNSCIYNPHGWAFNMKCSKKQLLYAVIEKIAAMFCKKIICISEAEKQSALNNKICSEYKLQVIFNGIDIEQYESQPHKQISRSELCIHKDAFVLGMVGRLSQQKAPDIFIKVAAKIKRTIPEAYFIIVGNGEQEEEVKEYAKKHGMEDSLLITGWVDNPIDYIELFDIALLLSRWEGFGLVLPEYMMAEKPIIATRVDAIPNIIRDRINGLLVEADDVEDIYEAIIELKENNELRDRLIAKGLEEVHSRFNARRMAMEHEELFDLLLE